MTSSSRIAAVTGASGFLGEVLVNRLLTDQRVRVLMRQPSALSAAWAERGCEVILGDLDDEAALARLAAGADVVYHGAATLAKTDAALSQRVNVAGTEHAARAAQAGGVRRFLYVSSTSVYLCTPRRDNTLTEDDEPTNLDGLNNYSRTKYEGELAIRRLGREPGLAYTIIRPTNIYGLRSGPWFRQWEQLLKKVPLAIGTVPIDLVYVDDVAEAMIKAAESPAAQGETFNLGHEMVPMNRLIVEIGRVTGRRARVMPEALDRGLCFAIDRLFQLVTRTALSPSLVTPVYYPHTKAARLVGYSPRFPLAAAFVDLQRQVALRAAG